jgi:hypothetical protein
MSGRMNWDRVRRNSLSIHHGFERVNLSAEAHPHSCPTRAKPHEDNRAHSKTCRCKACKAYLLLIKELNPNRFEELTQNTVAIVRPESQTKRRFANQGFGSGNSFEPSPKFTGKKSPRSEFTPPRTPIAGCTCGKTLGFTGLHKKKCALTGVQSAPNINAPKIPIIGCTCGKTLEFSGGHARKCALVRSQPLSVEKPISQTDAERAIALVTFTVLKQFERLLHSNDLRKPENVQRILARVRDAMTSGGGELAANAVHMNVQSVVSKAIVAFIEHSIAIPKIVLVRNAEVAIYQEFILNLNGFEFKPHTVPHRHSCTPEARLEDYIVRGLVNFDDVSYHEHHDLLYKLAGAVIRHLQSYLSDEDDLRNVLQFHQAQIVDIVHHQMQLHKVEKAAAYDVRVTAGFTTLRPQSYFIPKDVSHRNFRFVVDERLYSRGVSFGGFKKCLSASQRFHSEAERRFALLLEDSINPTIVRWIKPENGFFQIYDEHGVSYQPDFLVETRTCKVICDLRNHRQIKQNEVQRASEPAVQWCEYATVHETKNGGKPWSYLLIPEYAVKDRPSWALWRTQLKIESPTKFERLFG